VAEGRVEKMNKKIIKQAWTAVVLVIMSYSVQGWADGPNSYSSRNDTAILNSKPPATLSGLLGVNHKYSDPQYGGNYVIRVTDANTIQNAGVAANKTFLTPAASENNIFNSDNNAFVIAIDGGAKLQWRFFRLHVI
jgi:hypothetical protein